MRSKKLNYSNVIQNADIGAYMPAFEDLRARSGLSPDALKRSSVSIPTGLFKLLVREVVRRQPFDESAYLAANPDVAQALSEGKIGSAHEHYVSNGYFEGRTVVAGLIDEAWYLRNNLDVAQAVKSGTVESGISHFESNGRVEGRAGNEAAAAAKGVWDTALAKR